MDSGGGSDPRARQTGCSTQVPSSVQEKVFSQPRIGMKRRCRPGSSQPACSTLSEGMFTSVGCTNLALRDLLLDQGLKLSAALPDGPRNKQALDQIVRDGAEEVPFRLAAQV